MTKRSNDVNDQNSNIKRIFKNDDLSIINESCLRMHEISLIKNDSTLSLFDDDLDCHVPKMCHNSENLRSCDAIRLSHLVIVDSVLMERSIDANLEAILPFTLNSIYQKFKCSKTYIESLQTKEEFYRGVGLFGIGIEERIYRKRKALEESLKQRIRLRPNPKQKRKFDGSIINGKSKNVKVKFNIFTIGTDNMKRSQRHLRRTIKKRSVTKGPSTQKINHLKKVKIESHESIEESNVSNLSIALSRTKRKTKGPQLDFKYCYNDGDGVLRARKFDDTPKDDQFMEIIDSDSSSVVEVSPPLADKENNESQASNHGSPKCVIIPRIEEKPKENKALNLLDKLRLGLQCSVIQTDQDVIIQHLTVDDLSTLRCRLQGLATFKNIEAEYDKNGMETARATIDKKVFNLPVKSSGGRIESQECGELFKKRMLASIGDKTRAIIGQKDEFCATWVRPKVRFVKKIRKLYTQSASTPNILARSQMQNRPETMSWPNNKYHSNNEVSNSAPVSFYPQLTSAITDSIMSECTNTSINGEYRMSNVESLKGMTDFVTTSVAMPTTTTAATSVATITDNSDLRLQKSGTTPHVMSPIANGTPATAMSASQLLMLRKGAATGSISSHCTCDSLTSSTSTISMSNNDQLFTNQILRPYKKSIVALSPSKLEIDDEEGYPEMTHSHIANVSIAGTGTFISKPLIQTTTMPRRAIQLFQHTILPNTATRLAPCSTIPLVAASPLPIVGNPNSYTFVSSNQLLTTVATSPNLRVKHRKWTHNFLTSNSINFREVLCAPVVTTPQTLVALHSSVSAPAIVTSTVRPLTTTIVTATNNTKSSSVVLKSLLVGSKGTGGGSKSGTVLWAPKCLTGGGGEHSKIKWQVGGSIVTDTNITNSPTTDASK